MTAAAARRPASPYARRLARERGVELALITGSGPGGRIVAADLEGLLRERPAEPSRAPAAALATVSAYTAVLDLGPLQQLLGNLAAARTTVSLDDMLVRAAAVALEAVPVLDRDGMITLGLETGSGPGARLAVVADAHLGLVSALHAKLEAALVATPDPIPVPALTLRRLAQRGIRPTAMPLLAGAVARLVVSVADGDLAAEALLAFDPATLGEDEAAAFLAWFRDSLETPLRLLA